MNESLRGASGRQEHMEDDRECQDRTSSRPTVGWDCRNIKKKKIKLLKQTQFVLDFTENYDVVLNSNSEDIFGEFLWGFAL